MFARKDLRKETACSVNKVQRKLSDSSKISRLDMSTAFRGKFAKDTGFYVHAKEEQTIQKKTGNVVQCRKFIGNPAAVHIHLEGKRYHIKNSITNTRFDFDPNNSQQVQHAYHLLQNDPAYAGDGNAACQRWMEKNL